ncbi:pilus assembly protein TadG-related protein [Acidithiobacillus thiooxidans]|uniref:pilus assembly protein TadG-related protein n=1 Tax=Acidithiobacillus thiooxidans TaxID=930 RepID=UPI003563FF85
MKIIKFRKCRQKNNAAAAPRQESGQAAIFALLLIPTAIAAMLLVFNTGQLTANKLRVQNAADAAAFSAMELQARQMNIDAYLNRAMLANEVAIGQAVAILSWSRYAKRAGENIEDLTSKVRGVPYLGQAIAGAGEVIKASSLLVYGSGVAYTNSFMVVANTMDAAYSGAQQAFNLALGVSTPSYARKWCTGALQLA